MDESCSEKQTSRDTNLAEEKISVEENWVEVNNSAEDSINESRVMKDFIEECGSSEKVSIEENSSMGESSAAAEDSIEESSLTEECSIELSSSSEEDSTEQSSSSEEDSTEQSSSMEEDSIEDSSSEEDLDLEEDPEDDSLEEEDSVEESSLEEENSEEDLDLEEDPEDDSLEEEDSVEESSLEEENSAEEISSVEENSVDESSSVKYNSAEDINLVEKNSAEDTDLLEENSTEEEISSTEEEMKENWIEEHGLVFQDMNPIEKRHRTVQIVMVGSGDCGKRKLIENVFRNHHSFTITTHETRTEFRISLSNFFHIWICDVTDINFERKENFSKKAVFLFCYDIDNPKSFASIEESLIGESWTWGYLKRNYFLVCIKCDSKTKLKAIATINRDTHKRAIEKKVKKMNRHVFSGMTIECSIDDKRSLLNVFQYCMDIRYPRF